MAKKVRELTPPKGLARRLFRLPIFLYKVGLGWIFGNRFLMLNHIGRKSGLTRHAVLEVVQHDPQTDVYVVAVGFGETSQWYRNILARPEVSITVGRRKLDVTAERLDPQAAGQVLQDFARRYPNEARMAGLLGFEVDGSDEDYRQMGTMLPMVALRPR